VLNQRLKGREWIMGEDYTIADIAILPWVRNLVERYKVGDLVGYSEFTEVQRVLANFVTRPAVAKGLTVPPAPN
jgi:GST-like protein